VLFLYVFYKKDYILTERYGGMNIPTKINRSSGNMETVKPELREPF